MEQYAKQQEEKVETYSALLAGEVERLNDDLRLFLYADNPDGWISLEGMIEVKMDELRKIAANMEVASIWREIELINAAPHGPEEDARLSVLHDKLKYVRTRYPGVSVS